MLQCRIFAVCLLFLMTTGHWNGHAISTTTTTPTNKDDFDVTMTPHDLNADCDHGYPATPGRFDGKQTTCSRDSACSAESEELDLNLVYPKDVEWFNGMSPLAVVIVRDTTPNTTKILRETDIVSDCRTISSAKPEERPKWVSDLLQLDQLSKKLESHCFSSVRYARNARKFSFLVLHKVAIEMTERNRDPVFAKKIVAFILPNEREYMVVKTRLDLDHICTCQVPYGCGGFGQVGLAATHNLTAILNRLSG